MRTDMSLRSFTAYRISVAWTMERPVRGLNGGLNAFLTGRRRSLTAFLADRLSAAGVLSGPSEPPLGLRWSLLRFLKPFLPHHVGVLLDTVVRDAQSEGFDFRCRPTDERAIRPDLPSEDRPLVVIQLVAEVLHGFVQSIERHSPVELAAELRKFPSRMAQERRRLSW